MATKLQIWNKALRLLGLPRLESVTDNVPTSYELEDAWPNTVLEVFEAGEWNYATKTVSSVGSTSGHISGYAYAHTKPSGWLRTLQVCASSDFSTADEFRDEGGYLHSNTETIYIRYITENNAEDADVANWPPSLTDLIATRLALEVVPILRPGERGLYEFVAQVYVAKLEIARKIDDASQHVQHRTAAVAVPGGTTEAIR